MNKPTQPDWYWFRTDVKDEWKMAQVRQSDIFTQLVADFYPGPREVPLDQIGNRCEWNGPIPPPIEAEKEHVK